MMVWKECSKSLANKIIAHLSQINRNYFLLPSWNTHIFGKGLCWAEFDWNLNHLFSNLEGGFGGPPQKKIENQ